MHGPIMCFGHGPQPIDPSCMGWWYAVEVGYHAEPTCMSMPNCRTCILHGLMDDMLQTLRATWILLVLAIGTFTRYATPRIPHV
jgi:hypothetical protein